MSQVAFLLGCLCSDFVVFNPCVDMEVQLSKYVEGGKCSPGYLTRV